MQDPKPAGARQHRAVVDLNLDIGHLLRSRFPGEWQIGAGAVQRINAGTVRAMTIAVERCIVSRDLTEPRLSPDGRCIVYAMASGGSAALMIDMLDGTPVRQLTAYPAPRPGRGFGGGCWCWTPDGSAVIYAGVDGNLWLQPVPTGSVRRLTEHGPERTAAGPAVVADGSRVVYVVDDCELWVTRVRRRWGRASSERLDAGTGRFHLRSVCDPGWQRRGVPGVERSRHAVGQVTDPAVHVRSIRCHRGSRARNDPAVAVHARWHRGLPSRRSRMAQRVARRRRVDRRTVRARRSRVGDGPALVRRLPRRHAGRLHPQRARVRPVVRRRCATAAPSTRWAEACMGSSPGMAAVSLRCDPARERRPKWSCTTMPRGSGR